MEAGIIFKEKMLLVDDRKNPKILILDEPFNGLDKEGVEEMRKYLLNYKEEGKTILICSHSSEDIAILCDSVHEMEKGRMRKLKG